MTQVSLVDETLYSALGDDPDLAEIVDLFVDEMPEKIDVLINSIETEDWDSLHRVAHQLKGSVGSYGFDQLTPFASRLERSLKERRPEDEIEEALQDLVAVCQRVRKGVPEC